MDTGIDEFHVVATDRERDRPPGGRRVATAAGRRAARGPRPHRYAPSAARRASAARAPCSSTAQSARSCLHARRPGRRRRRHHRRGPGATAPRCTRCSRRSWTSRPSSAASARRASCHDVELLRARPGAVGDRDPGGTRRQHVPVHRLRTHRQRPRAGLPQRPGGGAIDEHTTQWVGQGPAPQGGPGAGARHVVYVDDLTFPGMLHAAVLRSPHAHARIVSDRHDGRAGACPAFTPCSPDRVAGPHRTARPVRGRGGRRARDRRGQGALPRRGRGRGRRRVALHRRGRAGARHRGVRTAARGHHGEQAMADGALLVHENLESNVVYQHEFSFGEVDADFAAADHVVRRRLFWPRCSAAPMETAGAVCPLRSGVEPARRLVEHEPAQLRRLGHVRDPRRPPAAAELPPDGGRRLVRLQAFPGQADRRSRRADQGDRAAGEVHGGPRGQPARARRRRRPSGSRRASWRSTADGTFRSLRIRVVDDYGAYFMLAIAGNTNLLAQIIGPYRIGSVELRRDRGADEQEPTGRVARRRLRREQLGPRTAGGRGGRRAGHRPGRAAPAQLHRRPTSSRTRSRPATCTTPGTTRRCWTGRWSSPTSTTGARSRSGARAQGRHIGIGVACAQQRSTYFASEFWFHNIGAPPAFTTTAESVRLRIGPTGGITATLFAPAWGNSQETVAAAADRRGVRGRSGRDRRRPTRRRCTACRRQGRAAAG